MLAKFNSPVLLIAALALVPALFAQVPAAIVSPANHSTLYTSSVTFHWTIGSGTSRYWLYVGTAQGYSNLFGQDEILATSQTVNGLPNGTLYVRLWTLIGSTWQFNDYTYTESGGTTPATITAPTNRSTLSTPSITFHWTTGTGASSYLLYVGTALGSGNIFANNEGSATSQTVNGLTNGTIYVRLYTVIGSTWSFNDYTYTETGAGTTPAALTSPMNHSNVFGTSVRFQWTTGNGSSNYLLYVGTAQGLWNIFAKNEGLATSEVVNGLPSGTIYVRLWTLIGTTWYSNDYTYVVFPVGDDYSFKSSTANIVNAYTGFYTHNCTDFVAWRMNRDRGYINPSTFWFKNQMPNYGISSWGDAVYWKARATGHFRVDSIPAVGAVAYFSYGHVAYVESVNADGSVNISEYNYPSASNNASTYNYGVRNNVTGVTAYIHIVH